MNIKLIVLVATVVSSSIYAADAEDIFYDASAADTCPICLDEKLLNAQANCGHSFCKPCIQEWMDELSQTAPRCPICRTTIQTINGVNISDNYFQPYYDHYENVGEIVALQYQADVRAFIESLYSWEYAEVLRQMRGDVGKLQTTIATRPEFGDPSYHSLTNRIALFLHEYGLRPRPGYLGSWSHVWLTFIEGLAWKREQRQWKLEERLANNRQAYLDYMAARR